MSKATVQATAVVASAALATVWYLSARFEKPKKKEPQLLFYNGDFCPFSQRAWLAVLEKEIPHKLVEINLMDKPDEFLAVSPHGTVPAGVLNGKKFFESLEFSEYLDRKYPNSGTKLTYKTPEEWFRAQIIIKDHIAPFVGTFYRLLRTQLEDTDDLKTLTEKFFESLETFDNILRKSGGPYFLGSAFGLADIALLPFIERAEALYPYYKDIQLDFSALPHFAKWRAAVGNRKSFKITSSDRSKQSMAVQPFPSSDRHGYLRDVYRSYHYNKSDEVRAEFAKDPSKPLSKEQMEKLFGKDFK